MKEIENYQKSIFESIKHIDENGNEYWLARELQTVLEYAQWRRFDETIIKAKKACEKSKNKVLEHFANVGKIVKAGATTKKIKDYKLSRYACYLIVQNGDSRKETIALGQTYFAVQTRKQELTEKEYFELSEDERRLYKRNKTKKANFSLQQTAKKAGVRNFDQSHNWGYKGLYNGETADDIAKRKKLRYREEILDNMSSEELAANEFRITQAEAKLKRDNIHTEVDANETHFQVGKVVRSAIEQVGGTMPENLATPKKSLKELEKNKSLSLENKQG